MRTDGFFKGPRWIIDNAFIINTIIHIITIAVALDRVFLNQYLRGTLGSISITI